MFYNLNSNHRQNIKFLFQQFYLSHFIALFKSFSEQFDLLKYLFWIKSYECLIFEEFVPFGEIFLMKSHVISPKVCGPDATRNFRFLFITFDPLEILTSNLAFLNHFF